MFDLQQIHWTTYDDDYNHRKISTC